METNKLAQGADVSNKDKSDAFLGLSETYRKNFNDRIKIMNEMYRLPINESPTLLSGAVDRLTKFKKILMDEASEIDDILPIVEQKLDIDALVAIADVLGDIVVYCRSEAMKYGIPLEAVLDIIMDSNESKLDANGNPIYDENGKFLKGPNYWKPEPMIKVLLERLVTARKECA